MRNKAEVWDIEYRDVILFVDGWYSPEEIQMTYTLDGSGYPGAPSEFEIYSVKCCNQNIIELLDEDQLREIEILILREHYDEHR